YVCLVLHAHLPFVRHPEHRDALEERWLFEAVLETYLPLLAALEGWRRDGIDFHLTLSLSPPLAAMLRDPLLRERCRAYLRSRVELAELERARTRLIPALHAAARYYHEHFSAMARRYDAADGGD